MKISEVIKSLQHMQNVMGDLPVVVRNMAGDIDDVEAFREVKAGAIGNLKPHLLISTDLTS